MKILLIISLISTFIGACMVQYYPIGIALFIPASIATIYFATKIK